MTSDANVDFSIVHSGEIWDGWTALHFTIDNVILKNAKCLLRYGASAIARNDSKETACQFAARKGNAQDIVKFLSNRNGSVIQVGS